MIDEEITLNMVISDKIAIMVVRALSNYMTIVISLSTREKGQIVIPAVIKSGSKCEAMNNTCFIWLVQSLI